ncbi:MAG: hypothetical protein ACQKHC_01025 [Candidatus Phytoplasma pruni]|uniref:hypothetical protein n=1 Tax=Milkweed yellows phytoplasma TaxID=208434 RepID=UPI000374D56D|nr:hypothetical protein [Milkweed yellows phytoplasma]
MQQNPQQAINGTLDTAFTLMPVPGLKKVAGSKVIKAFSKKLPKLLQKKNNKKNN